MNKILIIFAVAIFIISCANKIQDTIYLLPNSFDGTVIVIYNQEIGDKIFLESNRRLIKVPSKGIVLLSEDLKYGFSNPPEIYFNSIDKKNKLEVLLDYKDIKQEGKFATLPSIGKLYNKDKGKYLEYEYFFVGTKPKIDTLSDKFNSEILNEFLK